MKIQFTQPLILLIIPAGLLLLVFSMRFMYVKSKELRIKQIILRGIIFVLCILALSGMKVLKTDDHIATVFVVDGSDSVREYSGEVVRFISDSISKKTANDYVGVVSFGKSAGIENFLSNEAAFSGIKTNIDTSATDIESAVELALSMMPEGYARRIVIFSDGAENEGSLKSTAASIALAKCEVKAYVLPGFNANEVYISNLEVPDSVGSGEYFNIIVEIESNVTTPAKLSLYLGRTLTGQQDVNIVPGKNKFVFRDRQTVADLKTYRVTLDALTDTLSANNEYSAFTNIVDKEDVLIIDGGYNEGSELQKLFNSLGIDNIRMTAGNAPSTLDELNRYSAVVMCNVNATHLPEGFMNVLETYVQDFSKGLIVCGGRSSFALGNYKDTVLEKILPVEMDIRGENEIPSMAIMMVIDKSGSMSSNDTGLGINNLEIAKEAAIKAVDTLRETDYAGVISFDDSYTIVSPINQVGTGGDIKRAIGSINIEGGTSIYPAIEAAVKELAKSSAAIKHIILLTDGQDSYNTYTPLIQRMNSEGITLSSIGVGLGCNQLLLSSLSAQTGGRFYLAGMGTDIPQIFANEIYLSANTYIVEGDIVPVVNSLDPLISDVVSGGVPALNAYVATTAKPRAVRLLSSDQDDPLLAYWSYGLGKTVIWASDVSGQWSGNFFAWENNALLWNNLISFVTQDRSRSDAYAEVKQTGTKTSLSYHTEDFNAGTKVVAVVSDADGNAFETEMKPTAPGEYSTDFELTDTGVYSIAVKQYAGSEVVSGVNTAAIRKYSGEYTFNHSESLLEDYTALVGGSTITEPSEVFTDTIAYVKAMSDFTLPLMIAALLLFILDIAYRRFRFRIVPEGFWTRFLAKLRIQKASTGKVGVSARASSSPVVPAANSADASSDASSKRESAGKAPSKSKPSPKKKTPDVIDTSQLLGRMKK